MFFRGALIQRDGHGVCDLFPAPALPSKTAPLFQLAWRMALEAVRHVFLVLSATLRSHQVHNCRDRRPLIALSSPFAQPSTFCAGLQSNCRMAAHHKGLVQVARASDVCQASIGESCSVS